MSCRRCDFFHLSEEAEEHIEQRHFLFENVTDFNHSVFFTNLISPYDLFGEVLRTPRRLLIPGGWSGNRFVYFLWYDVDVGFFPLRPEWRANIVKIVCDCVQCPICLRNSPTEIVTIYPTKSFL